MRFLDSSAIVKLALDEPESDALIEYVGDDRFVASELCRTEVIRAVARRDPRRVARATSIVSQAMLARMSTSLLTAAGQLPPQSLRSLDAIQLASALQLGEELTAFVAYDERLLAAASTLGMPIASPGAERHL